MLCQYRDTASVDYNVVRLYPHEISCHTPYKRRFPITRCLVIRKVDLLHQVMTTIAYIVERQWNLKWVSNQRTAAYFTMVKRHLLLHIFM